MKIGNLNVSIGSDPELFVKRDGKFVSGHELIPGTKENPHPVPQGAVQVDGTALEFNTRPALTLRAFNYSSNKVIAALQSMIPDDYELVASPVADYTKEYLASLPKKATELGCSPDYNAYTGMENPIPDVELPFRTGSGHIHIGWTDVENPYSDEHMFECRALTQALDVFLGVPSLMIDKDKKRRKLYGKAGAFRPKSYGLEYRVLSNFWVLDDKLRGWVWNNTKHAIERAMNRLNPLPRYYSLRGVIDKNDYHTADQIIKTFEVPLPEGYHVEQHSPSWW